LHFLCLPRTLRLCEGGKHDSTAAVHGRACGVADSPITGAQAKQQGTLVTDSLTLARAISAMVWIMFRLRSG